MSYIVATKKNKVLSPQYGSVSVGANVIINAKSGETNQLWKFLYTKIPGVFYIASYSDSTYVLTVPENAQNLSQPTLEEKQNKYNRRQLWRLVPSSDGANSMIQNYDTSNGNGLMLDTDNGNNEGQITHLWPRNDNDNQKWDIEAE